MSSGGILSLSTWSRSTLAHFCSDSIMVQGRDISATNTARQSRSEWVETANLSRPLWYRSPSRIQTLHRVRSAKEIKSKYAIGECCKLLQKDYSRWTHHLCPHRGHLSTDTPVPSLSCCDRCLEVWPQVSFFLIHPHLQDFLFISFHLTLFTIIRSCITCGIIYE